MLRVLVISPSQLATMTQEAIHSMNDTSGNRSLVLFQRTQINSLRRSETFMDCVNRVPSATIPRFHQMLPTYRVNFLRGWWFLRTNHICDKAQDHHGGKNHITPHGVRLSLFGVIFKCQECCLTFFTLRCFSQIASLFREGCHGIANRSRHAG